MNNRRDFCKALVGSTAALAVPAVAAAKPAQLLFEIDHEYVKKQWKQIVSGKPKRGAMVVFTREAFFAAQDGRLKFTMPKGHVVDIGYEFMDDTVLVKLWGDHLPVVREGEVYSRIDVVTTRGQCS